MMTFKELKSQIRDLGFEEDVSMEEYKNIVINSSNRAINLILKTVVERAEGYFKSKFEESAAEGDVWKLPEASKLTLDTQDDFVIDLPEKVVDLVPLLAAHYVWLDDDERKATFYWNEYDDLKEQILSDCLRGSKARIIGGYRFG